MQSVLGNKRAVAVLLGPALAVYTVVMLIPILWSTGYSFYEGNAIRGFDFVGLQNYRDFIDDKTGRDAVWFSAKYAIVMTTLQVSAGLLLSLLYVFYLKRSSALVRTIVFFPVILPTVAVALMFKRLFEAAPSTGPVNAMLNWLNFDSIDWFGQPGHAFWVIILMDLWRSMGFYGVLLYAGLVDIPDDVIEAARLDGASGWALVRRIVVPLSLPVILSSVIFSINGTLKVFDSVIALTNGGPGSATTPLTLYMFRTSFAYGEYGYGSTVAMALAIMCLVATVFVFNSTRRDLTK